MSYNRDITECKVFFTTQKIGRVDNTRLLIQLDNEVKKPKVIILRGPNGKYPTYDQLVKSSRSRPHEKLLEVTRRVLPHQVCNLQFTSGTTGNPKAAMLTHQ